MAVVLALGGCSRTEMSPPPTLIVELHDSADIRILDLSHTLHEIARGDVEAAEVIPDLQLGKGTIWFGSVADIASLGGGRFAVLDRMERHIDIFDSLGHRIAQYGREGEGPGEYKFPLALASVGDKLVVWQNRRNLTFTVVGPGGAVVSTGRRSVEGDWIRPSFRFPIWNLEDIQMGPEDVTRRLQPFGDDGFVHQLQLDEQQHIDPKAPVDFPAPPVYLIRYGLDASVRDTIAILSGPPTLLHDEQLPGSLPTYKQPLFSGRPVWAMGEGWLATGHGDSAQVVVRDFSGEPVLMVRWPGRRPAVTENDKIEATKWFFAIRVARFPRSKEIYGSMSRSERLEAIERQAFEYTPFAVSSPAVTAAYAAGQCLFLSGYSPGDWADGTALTWVALNVRKGSLESVFRILPSSDAVPLILDRRGAVLREFDLRIAYTVQRGGDALFLVQRYRLPKMDCEG